MFADVHVARKFRLVVKVLGVTCYVVMVLAGVRMHALLDEA